MRATRTPSGLAKGSLTADSEIYHERAEIYEELCRAEDADGAVLRALLPFAQGARVLDVGCGTGKYLDLLSGRARSMLGVDASEGQLAVARAKLAGRSGVELLRADAAEDEIPGGPFDLAIACWMLGTILDESKRARAVDRALGALRPGGWLLAVENDSRGEFEEIRGRIPASSAYNRWLQDEAGFEVLERLDCRFRFASPADARRVFGAIWGQAAAERVASREVEHSVLLLGRRAKAGAGDGRQIAKSGRAA